MTDTLHVATNGEMIDKALASADLNALRMALYQATGDENLTGMRVVGVPVWGGVMLMEAVAPEHHDEVRQKAKAYLLSASSEDVPQPSHEEARRLLEIYSGRSLSEDLLELGVDELAFDDFPREVTWNSKPAPDVLAKLHVAIIGSGVSGIAAAVQLTRLGIPYTMFERQSDIGGTWHINAYPEARVDIPSHNYQYHFEKKYPWSSLFANGPENVKYLNQIVDKYGVRPNVRVNTEVTAATWDEAAGLWHIRLQTEGGAEETISSQFLISACGLFNKPKYPDIPGIGSFKGRMFHTTAWDQSYDYGGKRIGVIGNGSTGSQAVPALAQQAGKLTVFMRTPHWVFPMENYFAKMTTEAQWLIDTMPNYWNWFSYGRFVTSLHMQDVNEYDAEWQAKGGRINERNDRLREVLTAHIRTKMAPKPELVEKLIPKWTPLARRPVVDSGWYDTLLRDNVELVTDSIDHFTPTGIVTADGTERELDLVVLAAGFEVSKFLWPVEYRGRNGATLESVWEKDGARSYLGMLIPDFPNFFIFYGPNGQPRAGGFHSWAEQWARYILLSIVHVIENKQTSINLKKQVFDDYNASLDARAKNLVRNNEGQGSYHFNEFGRMVVNVPWLAEEYATMIRAPKFDEFVIQ